MAAIVPPAAAVAACSRSILAMTLAKSLRITAVSLSSLVCTEESGTPSGITPYSVRHTCEVQKPIQRMCEMGCQCRAKSYVS